MSTQVRVAASTDVPQLARLIAELDQVELSPSELSERLAAIAGVETIFVAERDGELAGYAGLRLAPFLSGDYPRAELSELYVRPAHRRQGVGRALVECAVERARERGARRMFLLTSQQNDSAQAFYRVLGFGGCLHAMTRDIA